MLLPNNDAPSTHAGRAVPSGGPIGVTSPGPCALGAVHPPTPAMSGARNLLWSSLHVGKGMIGLNARSTHIHLLLCHKCMAGGTIVGLCIRSN